MLTIEGCVGNHAVLQHGQNILISGTAIPNHHLRCELGDIEVSIQSSNEGAFKITLPPMAPTGPLTLQISDLNACDRLVYCDIYIGNVYLIAGQSNMALTLEEANDIQQEYSDNLIRQFAIKKQALIKFGHRERDEYWQMAENDMLKDFSAVGFHCAQEMRKICPDIAIGLINASYGGTNIEAWISRETLLKSPITQKEAEIYEAEISQVSIQNPPDREVIEQDMLEKLFPRPFPNFGVKKCWHESDFDDQNWEQMILPDSWTLAGYNSPGIFWFRREIDLPDAWTGKSLQLHLGAIDHQDITYWNGIKIGCTGNGLDITHWNELRCYSIPSNLLKAGKNQIAVRISSFFPICSNGGFIGPEKEMYLGCEDDQERRILLTGVWKYQPEKILPLETLERCRHLGSGEAHSYHIMFDNMISPIKNCTLAAILFYQGEANTLGETNKYEGLLKLLIEDWRLNFAQTDLDFLIVQLPGFQTPRLYSEYSQWAKIREAQLKAGLSIGIPPIVITESGLAYDLHPPDKSVVGRRLAMTALAVQGNSDFPISGPVYRRMEKLPEGKIRLHFELYGSKMLVNGECIKHLVIAGADAVFHKAKSHLNSPETLLVWSDAVANPEVVRYAWCENPAHANLYNQAGQPASPFRTDTEYNFV